jgi:hypothetical protein
MFDFFDNRTKVVRARVWRNDANFQYPEDGLDSLAGKSDLGVAFSGGGTRSASAVAGQLRGLKAIGLLDKVKYFSCVSGGTWGAAPFVFLPDNFDEDEFLGAHLEPEDITPFSLKDISKKSLVYAASNSFIVDDFFKEAAKMAGDETYARAVGDIFLGPFDLNDNGRFMSFDQTTLADVLQRNDKADDKKHYLREKDFYTVRSGRPFFIAGATLFTDQKRVPRVHTEFTPYYSGTRNFFNLPDAVGGGYVESIGCDSHRPKTNAKTVKVKLGSKKHRFALSDMIGTSGAAPQELLLKAHLGFVGFPEFRHWGFKPPKGFSDDEELSYGDGGHLENLGIMPLLARRVKNIIVFVNSKTPFSFNADNPLKSEIATSIPNLFKPADGDGWKMNLVIKDDDQHTGYLELLQAFQDAKVAGQPLVHQAIYDIRSNKPYSVKAYKGVQITWVYNQDVDAWRTRLPFHTDKMIRDGEVKHFPHYKTFFQNPPKVIDLSKAEVGLLAHLACWVVREKGGVLSSLVP